VRETTATRWAAPVLIVVATFATAAIGAFASIDAQTYYASLKQPAWAPPAWLFGPAWTTLYTLMAVAACLVVRRAGLPAARPALALYGLQLVLNALWTWLFFRWHLGAWATAEVLMLLGAIALTARAFWRIRPIAGWLLAPYLAWVTFASALTVSVWRLNPTML
jgi:tryptophan-rich sensory protein